MLHQFEPQPAQQSAWLGSLDINWSMVQSDAALVDLRSCALDAEHRGYVLESRSYSGPMNPVKHILSLLLESSATWVLTTEG